MKLKRLILIFEFPLTKVIHYQDQDVTQEDILLADVDGIRNKVKRELDKVLRSVNMVRIMNPAMFDVLKFHVQGLERKLVWMIEFKKITPTRYEFIFPTDANALLTIKDISSKLGPLKKFTMGKLENKDLQLVKLLREAELTQAFEKFTFREMLLEPGTWSISSDEFESDPEEIEVPLPPEIENAQPQEAVPPASSIASSTNNNPEKKEEPTPSTEAVNTPSS